ncbi:MAG: hypothetical protein HY645_11525 [Acidobacteria bacterium]|nr:hypothetical protein [Acidobacteriota bacterium]
MKRWSLVGIFSAVLLASTLVQADVLILRDGRTIQGTYLGGDARVVRMAVGTRVESFDVTQISQIRFGDVIASAPSQTAPQTTRPVAEVTENVIPSGTLLMVRMVDSVDSEVSSVGETFRATMAEPVMSGGKVVIPKDSKVVVRLVEDKEAGKLTGRAELTLDMVSVEVDGKLFRVSSGEVTTSGQSRTGETAKVVGGLAGLGAIIGAVAGGGKGAAIGAVSGAGAGAMVQVLTKGPKVKIPSETRLEFTLQRPLQL